MKIRQNLIVEAYQMNYSGGVRGPRTRVPLNTPGCKGAQACQDVILLDPRPIFIMHPTTALSRLRAEVILMPRINLVGQRFGRLIVTSRAPSKPGQSRWGCQCDCGNVTEVHSYHLKSGNTRSCGCFSIERARETKTIHGLTKSKLYSVWVDMKKRCYNLSHPDYINYGARGITVCDEWRNSFVAFSADMGTSPGAGYSIERRDNNKGYSKDNCYWATAKEQSRNTRRTRSITYNGKTQCLKEWAEEIGMPYETLRQRIVYKNWPIERAMTETRNRS